MNNNHKNQANLKPNVFIIVLNYCSLQDTKECLDSIYDLEYDNYSVLVIDNASPDNSGIELKSILPAKQFLQLDHNTGYAEGNNTGIRKALKSGADYILVMNPDIRIQTNAITEYLKIFKANKKIGALNPIQLTADGQAPDRRFSWMIYGEHLSLKELLTDKYQLSSSPILLGASIMFSRQALEKTGGFDPLYFAYGEELDLCRRLRYHNFELAVTNKCPVVHLRTHEKNGTSDFVLFLRLKGIYLNELKDPNRPFRASIRATLKRLYSDLRYNGANYSHAFSKTHYLKVMWWIIWHSPSVYMHLQKEKKGQAYLQ